MQYNKNDSEMGLSAQWELLLLVFKVYIDANTFVL